MWKIGPWGTLSKNLWYKSSLHLEQLYSRYYHVIGELPPDAMHDILEGVLHYTIKEVLKVLIIDQQLFSLEELNNRILSLIMVTTMTRINPLQYKGTDFYLMITV